MSVQMRLLSKAGLLPSVSTGSYGIHLRRLYSQRLFSTQGNKKKELTNDVNINVPINLEGANKKEKNDAYDYLKNLNYSDLLSYLVMGACTINKPILNMCIKTFPYVPLPIIKALVYRIYCGGETLEEVNATGERLRARNINNMMLSLTIEACEGNDNIDPEMIVSQTNESITKCLVPHAEKLARQADINSFPPGYVALKPTGFFKDAANVLKNFNKSPEYAEKFDGLYERASKVCQTVYNENTRLASMYPDRVAPFVVAVVDAEKHDLQEGVYELQRRLYAKYNKMDKPVSVVGTLQMYLSGSSDLLSLEENLAKTHNYKLGLKLVRGAYIHSEVNRKSIIHSTKALTDKNYNKGISYCIDNILTKGSNSTVGHLVVASHNAESLKFATTKLNSDLTNSNRHNVVLGQLLGMADDITYGLIKNDGAKNVIKYVPWGPPLETKEYLLRRLEENGDAVRADNGFKLIKAVLTTIYRKIVRLA